MSKGEPVDDNERLRDAYQRIKELEDELELVKGELHAALQWLQRGEQPPSARVYFPSP